MLFVEQNTKIIRNGTNSRITEKRKEKTEKNIVSCSIDIMSRNMSRMEGLENGLWKGEKEGIEYIQKGRRGKRRKRRRGRKSDR